MVSAMVFGTVSTMAANIELLNVSYDPTRELYKEYNEAFNPSRPNSAENASKTCRSDRMKPSTSTGIMRGCLRIM
jgi:ABC-type sulfate transport system substrate-binding protein